MTTLVGKLGKRMSNILAHHHILWRNHWEIVILYGSKWLKYHTGINTIADNQERNSNWENKFVHWITVKSNTLARATDRGVTRGGKTYMGLDTHVSCWELGTKVRGVTYGEFACNEQGRGWMKVGGTLSGETGNAEPSHCSTLAEDTLADADWWDMGFRCCRVAYWKASEEESV